MSDQAQRIGEESGSTKSDPTALTTDALQREIAQLRELMERRIETIDAVNVQKYRAIEVQIAFLENQRLEQKQDTKDAVEAALLAVEKAVLKAEAAYDRRFESVEESRQVQQNQIALNMPRQEYDVAHRGLSERVNDLAKLIADNTNRLERINGTGAGQAATKANLYAAAGFAIGAIGLIVLVLRFATGQ